MPWIDACGADDLEEESGLRFDHGSKTFAIFRNHQNQFYCTDGLCTHEAIHLADGLVMENTVECPKHSSIFDFTTGEVETPPACESLRTYVLKVEAGRVMIDL